MAQLTARFSSVTRGPRFESSHRQILLNMFTAVCRKDENKEKRPGMAHFKKYYFKYAPA